MVPAVLLRRPGRTGGRPGAAETDGGAVTVEAALALSGLVLVTALAVGSVAAAAASVRCADAARELARLAARGEPDRGRALAARLAPAGAHVELVVTGDEVVAEVRAAPVRLLPVHVVGRAVAVLEPGAALSGPAGPDRAGPGPGGPGPGGPGPGGPDPGGPDPGGTGPGGTDRAGPGPGGTDPGGTGARPPADGEAVGDGVR